LFVGSGRLLNDVGLFFAQCRRHEPEKALSCFEEAQKISQRNSKDRELEATTLQNIGAIYNCMARYKEAIDSNTQASKIYGLCDVFFAVTLLSTLLQFMSSTLY